MASTSCSSDTVSDIGDELAVDLEGGRAGGGDREAVGDRRGLGDPNGVTHGEGPAGVVGGCRLDAEQFAAGIELSHRRGTACHQAASRHRDQQGIEPTDLVMEFQGRGSLTAHHQRILERVDEGCSGRRDLGECPRVAVGRHPIERHDVGAEAFDERAFGRSHVVGDVDRRRDAEDRRRARHRRAVIARRHRDHAELAILGRDQRQAVERPAELERSGPLLRLVLADDGGSDPLVEYVGAQDGRDDRLRRRSRPPPARMSSRPIMHRTPARRISNRRKPALEPTRSHVYPCSMIHRASESAPRCFWTTSAAVPSVSSRPSQVDNSSWSGSLPMRIGGLDQIVANERSAGTSSGWTVVMLTRPLRCAFRAQSSRARRLTSTAQMRAAGDRRAIVRAIGPAPHPRSRRFPVAARGSDARMSIDVAVSRCPWEKTPRSVSIVKAVSGRVTSTMTGSEAIVGSSSK